MQPYYFHLAFELQPSTCSSPQLETRHAVSGHIPQPTFDIFSASLPAHNTSSWASLFAPRQTFRRDERGVKTWSSLRKLPSRQHVSRIAPQPQGDHKTHPETVQYTEKVGSSHQALPQEVESKSLEQDWRFDMVAMDSIDMEAIKPDRTSGVESQDSSDMNGYSALKGRFVPSEPRTTELGQGVIHLYRDVQPTPGLTGVSLDKSYQDILPSDLDDTNAYIDKDNTTLCIIAIPSYMSPSDLLGWLGEDTGDHVSHLRLVRTSRSNRYMALMKFRRAEDAKKWQKDWNGKLFNSMEPENCHVVFIKSICFQAPVARDSSSFPGISNDPFTPGFKASTSQEANSRGAAALTSKPAPPPTPSLVELPTCPVCLERMDETNGLATIFCQHVFHCACLQKWRGSGCPVCRYTQNDPASRVKSPDDDTNECAICGATANLWICLICGRVGCGRYDEAHAFAHFEQTSHRFAMDVATQHIWDYVGDEYVHRLIQNKSDGKLVELPPSTVGRDENPVLEMVPRDKMENMSLEYTYLLTSQLDSQRLYFEEQRDRAVDKARKAAAEAAHAKAEAERDRHQLCNLQAAHRAIADEALPALERDRERAQRRADKYEKMSREMERAWRDDKALTESLMTRIKHLERQFHEATLRANDLEEQNRDLSFFISGMEKLRDAGDEVRDGSVSVGERPAEQDVGASGRKKGKKKR